MWSTSIQSLLLLCLTRFNTNEQPIVKVSVNLVEEDNTEKVSKIDINSVVEASVPHVLIVDDNKDIVELVADLLSPYCQTLKAFSVKEALEEANSISCNYRYNDA